MIQLSTWAAIFFNQLDLICLYNYLLIAIIVIIVTVIWIVLCLCV